MNTNMNVTFKLPNYPLAASNAKSPEASALILLSMLGVNKTIKRDIQELNEPFINEIKGISELILKKPGLSGLRAIPNHMRVLSFYGFLNRLIDEKVKLILNIDFENRDKINLRYNAYREKISLLRYESNGNMADEIISLIDEIENWLKDLGIKSKELVMNREVLDLSKNVLVDYALVEAHLDMFLNKKIDFMQGEFEYKMKVSEIKSIVVEFLSSIRANASSVFSMILFELKKYEKSTNVAFSKEVKKRSSDIKKMVSLLNKMIGFIDLKSTEDVIINIDRIDKVLEDIYQVFQGGGVCFGGATTFGNNTNALAVFKSILEDMKLSGNDLKDESIKYDLDKYRMRTGEVKLFKMKMGEWSFKEFSEFVEYQSRYYVWHTMADTSICRMLRELRKPYLPALKEWSQKNKDYKKLCSIIDQAPSISFNPGYKPKTIDEQVAFVMGTEPKRGGPSPKRIIGKTEQLQQQQVKSVPLSKPRWASHTIRDITKMLGSKELVISEVSRAALGNARIHLEDLSVVRGWLEDLDPIKFSTPSYLANQSARSTFYVLEQLLRYLILEKYQDVNVNSLGHHNLKRLFEKLHPKVSEHPKIFEQVSQAYVWTCYTFIQENGWKGIDEKKMPELLKMIVGLFEDPQFLKMDTLKQILEGYSDQALVFLNDSLKVETTTEKTDIIKKEPVIFKSSKKIDWKKFIHLAEECLKLEEALSSFADYVLRIMEVRKEIDSILCSLKKLRGSITSDDLPVLVKSTLYAQYMIFKGLLEVTSNQTTGLSIFEQHIRPHDLGSMYQSLGLTGELAESTLSFINKQFNQFNKIGRYPLQVKELMSPLHELILQAEMLRENPKLKVDQEMVKTVLIPIEVSSEGLNHQSIIDRLTKHLDETMQIIEKQFLSQFQKV